jgi:hypothetical protein
MDSDWANGLKRAMADTESRAAAAPLRGSQDQETQARLEEVVSTDLRDMTEALKGAGLEPHLFLKPTYVRRIFREPTWKMKVCYEGWPCGSGLIISPDAKLGVEGSTHELALGVRKDESWQAAIDAVVPEGRKFVVMSTYSPALWFKEIPITGDLVRLDAEGKAQIQESRNHEYKWVHFRDWLQKESLVIAGIAERASGYIRH